MEAILNVRVEIHRAIENQKVAEEYNRLHSKVLNKLGVKDLPEIGSWIENPYVYLITLYSGDDMVAGSRLHLYNEDHTFPFEEVVNDYVSPNRELNKRLAVRRTAEWCGLWSEYDLRGYGLGITLSRIMISVAHIIGLQRVVIICPRHSLDLFRRLGFSFIHLNDRKVSFEYPYGFVSWMVECNVDSLVYILQNEKKTLKEWLSKTSDTVVVSGRRSLLRIDLNSFDSQIPQLNIESTIANHYK